MSDKHEDDCLCLDCANQRTLDAIDPAPSELDCTVWLACVVRLLKAAVCPECDGSGAVQVQARSREYVSREMAMDAQCPEMEGSLYCDDEFEVERCQWCYERTRVLADYEAHANDPMPERKKESNA